MDLTDLIRNTTGGFLAGFVLGASGTCDRHDEKIEMLEAVLTKEEREKRGLSDEKIGEVKKHGKKGKLILPYVAGGVYSIFSGLATESSVSESMIITIPSAYVGRFVGSFVRKLARRKNKKELQVVRQIRDDPENALSYIPDSQREVIESTFGEVEKKILDGADLTDEELRGTEGPIKKMYNTIIEQNRVYSPALLKWSLKKLEDVCRTAHVQREVRQFYEENQPLALAVLGAPEKTSIMIYEVDGKNLSTYHTRFDDIRMIEKEGVGILVGSAPHIELEDRKDWNGDYKRIAKQVIQSQPENTIMLIKTLPGMPDQVRGIIVTKTFATAFVDYNQGDILRRTRQPPRRPYGFGDPSLN